MHYTSAAIVRLATIAVRQRSDAGTRYVHTLSADLRGALLTAGASRPYPAAVRTPPLPALLAVLLAASCAHSPAPAPGPRPLGHDVNLVRNAATLALRFRYEVAADRALTLYTEVKTGGSGSVGAVELAVKAEGFVVEGAASWRGELAEGAREEPRFILRPTAVGIATVTVDHAIAGATEGEPVVLRFKVSGDRVWPCATSDCVEPG